MPFFKKVNIEIFNKKNLFKRFALDNYLAIHNLIKKKVKITPDLKQLYEDTISGLDKSILEKRSDDLNNKKIVPDFYKKINS
jgi:hypothetical protein